MFKSLARDPVIGIKNNSVNSGGRPGLFYLIFAASGFAGLIYESIWTHYIQLFLGHAAYAQTLVLAIFMGGMAMGAWICSRRSGRWRNLLRFYALTELIIGILGLLFHPVFVRFLGFSYSIGIPSFHSATAILIFKWMGSAFLILPQSVLLGMLFPLMAGGLVRRDPNTPGATLAMLYFTNSLGAAIGVLASGFWLIAWVGLPGTVMTAGLINLLLAAWVWSISPKELPHGAAGFPESEPVQEPRTVPVGPGYRLFLFIALVTGSASFMYEIGWIRMLSLVLGSATHAFELMLSAFITGLALGGLWIRRRIDRYPEPTRVLAIVQMAMGALALGTLPVYNRLFEVMRWLVRNLDKTDSGYALFNLASHGISLAVMLPATFCAGMTLPLITFLLLRQGHGEKSIGAVYSLNTLGAILGVFFSIHVGMPEFGLKNLIVIGAACDIALGLLLVWRSTRSEGIKWAATAAGFGMVLAALLVVKMDPLKMASGVYRKGRLLDSKKVNVLYLKDGKTATIDVTRSPSGLTLIATNGKPEASIFMPVKGPGRRIAPDESTQILMGALPILLKPSARTVGNIGFGSGLTTTTLLTDPDLERVDTIEIEPAMVEGARNFLPRVSLAYQDPRSHIHIEDAKTYFSSHHNKYDIIISEPSNPWVSGVSGLFSVEFYGVVKKNLKDRGLLVQWLQLYESDPGLVASVVKALSSQFADYVIYVTDEIDIVIIATPGGHLPEAVEGPEKFPGLAMELRRINVRNGQDLELHRLGSKKILDPLFDSYTEPPNSDYFPVLDLNATRFRFLGADATILVSLKRAPVPIVEILEGTIPNRNRTVVSFNPEFYSSGSSHLASMLYHYLLGAPWDWPHKEVLLDRTTRRNAETAREIIGNCAPALQWELWVGSLHNTVAIHMIPYLSPSELAVLWSRLEGSPCWSDINPAKKKLIHLYQSVGRRNSSSIVDAARTILSDGQNWNPVILEYALAAAMSGEIAGGKNTEALELWRAHSDRVKFDGPMPLYMRLLVANSRVDEKGS